MTASRLFHEWKYLYNTYSTKNSILIWQSWSTSAIWWGFILYDIETMEREEAIHLESHMQVHRGLRKSKKKPMEVFGIQRMLHNNQLVVFESIWNKTEFTSIISKMKNRQTYQDYDTNPCIYYRFHIIFNDRWKIRSPDNWRYLDAMLETGQFSGYVIVCIGASHAYAHKKMLSGTV